MLFETRSDVSPLVAALPSNTAELEPHYEITLGGSARVADRAVQVLEIKPRDEFRYGYRLWLDQETAMPLQSQLIDEQGEVVEQILFTDIEIPADIPAAALEPTIDTTGFTTLRAAESDAARRGDSVARRDRARRLQALGRDAEPDRGLRHSRRASRLFRRSRDGVGVHRGSRDEGRSAAKGFSKVGSTNAYSLTLRGRKVTAMGEVPRQTVRTIASSLVAE